MAQSAGEFALAMRRGEPLKGFGFGVLESYWTLACVWRTCLVWRALAGLSMTGTHPKLTVQASAPHEACQALQISVLLEQKRIARACRRRRPVAPARPRRETISQAS